MVDARRGRRGEGRSFTAIADAGDSKWAKGRECKRSRTKERAETACGAGGIDLRDN